MSILTEDQRRAARESQQPIRLVDPDTHEEYLLIRADLFERIRPLFEDDPLTDSEQRFLLRQAGQLAGWDDPEMDVYNDLDPRRK